MSRGLIATEKLTYAAVMRAKFKISKGIEVRFSSEDSFRSNLVDILHLYQACDKAGVDRVYGHRFPPCRMRSVS
jgi:isopropylmalate/homocitrate/citramalate synthase